MALTFTCTRWWFLSANDQSPVLQQGEGACKNKRAELNVDMPNLKSRNFSEIREHNKNLENLPKELCVSTASHMDLPWIWFIFKPNWECAHKERTGEKFDGGKLAL